mgnify:CR=1 FL=1
MKRIHSLKKSYDIEKLVKRKQSIGNKYYALYYQLNNHTRPLIAISVSKKFGNAVKRNYEKRITREIITEKIQDLASYNILVVVKKNVESLTFSQRKEQMHYLLGKLKRKEDKIEK